MSNIVNSQPSPGRLFGIGVGPGDPELITLKAHRLISSVPVILIPQKDNESDSLAYSVVRQLVKSPEQKIESLTFPMLKSAEQMEPYWEDAAKSTWGHLEAGRDCAFITIGDPLLYGTFIYLLEKLRSRHPDFQVEIVPGISSVNAAAAAALTPLSSQNDRVAILSAERDDDFIRETLRQFDTVVFLKVNMIFAHLLEILTELRLVEQSVYIRRCSTKDQEIIRDIRMLKGRRLDYFSILIVRKK